MLFEKDQAKRHLPVILRLMFTSWMKFQTFKSATVTTEETIIQRFRAFSRRSQIHRETTLYNICEIQSLYFSLPFLNSQIIKYPRLKWRVWSSTESHSGFFANKMEEVDPIVPSVCSAKNDIIFGHLVLELLFKAALTVFPPTFCHFLFKTSASWLSSTVQDE